MNCSTVQWNHRMRNILAARPCVTSTREVCFEYRPAHHEGCIAMRGASEGSSVLEAKRIAEDKHRVPGSARHAQSAFWQALGCSLGQAQSCTCIDVPDKVILKDGHAVVHISTRLPIRKPAQQ